MGSSSDGPEHNRPTNDGLVWADRVRDLNRPVLIAGFEGWNDAADAASSAATWLTQHGSDTVTRLASIDPEAHFDFQARRPQVELIEGVVRTIRWPENVFSVVRGGARDLVVLRGIEPNYRWESFCSAVITVAHESGCEMVVTFGALLADVPHTRATRVNGTASDPDLVDRLGLMHSRYEGPTGIVGVLNDQCRSGGLPSVSLWAPVPHYLASPPNPPATLALLQRVDRLLALGLDLDRLSRTAVAWREKVDEVTTADEEAQRYVRTLEEHYDEEAASELSAEPDLPTGDDLATEVERFLRDQRGDT